MRAGEAAIVARLLEAGADPNLADSDMGYTPLYFAAYYGDTRIVDKLLEAGADPNLATKDGITPLHHAAGNRDTEIIDKLLEAGADPNLADYKMGYTALYYAVQNGDIELVEKLLKAGANPNCARIDGATPLFVAAQNDHREITRLLLENKDFDLNGINSEFKSSIDSLHTFARKNNVEARMENIINIKQRSSSYPNPGSISMTPRDIAYVKGNVEITAIPA